MKMWLKTWFAATATAAVAMTSGLSADYFYNNSDECCYQYGYTVPAHVEDECDCADFTVSAEWLYWKPCAEELELGVTKTTTLVTGTSSVIPPTVTNSHENHLDFKWDSGFRLGIGYNLPCDGWDLALKWTYFDSKAHDSLDPDGSFTAGGALVGEVFVPSFSGFVFPDNSLIKSASGRWKVDLNIVDLELGRAFLASPSLKLRPFIGLRWASIDQNYNLRYYGSLFQEGIIEDAFFDRVRMENDYSGFGLRLGLDTVWDLGCGFGIFFDGSASLLYGDLDVHQREFFTDLTGTIGSGEIHQRHHDRCVKANTDFNIGVQWATQCNFGRTNFLVRLGYEYQIFFAQNQFKNFVSTTPLGGEFADVRNDVNSRSNGGDLSFHGLTLLGQIDF